MSGTSRAFKMHSIRLVEYYLHSGMRKGHSLAILNAQSPAQSPCPYIIPVIIQGPAHRPVHYWKLFAIFCNVLKSMRVR